MESLRSRSEADGQKMVNVLTPHKFIVPNSIFHQFRPVKVSIYEKEERRAHHRPSLPAAALAESLNGIASQPPSIIHPNNPAVTEEDQSTVADFDREANTSIDVPPTHRDSIISLTPPTHRDSIMSVTTHRESSAPLPLSMTPSTNPARTRTFSGSVAGKKAINQVIGVTAHNHKYVKYDHISAKNFSYLPDAKVIFSCGHWDWSVRVTSVESGKLLHSLTGHNDVVNCLGLAKDYGNRWLVTGSRDCTLITWDIHLDRSNNLTITPIRTLYGHDDAINCLVINPELDMIVSGSDDGTMMVHNLRDGKYIRSILNTDATSQKKAMYSQTADDSDTVSSANNSNGSNTTVSTGSTTTVPLFPLSTAGMIQPVPRPPPIHGLSMFPPANSTDEDHIPVSGLSTPVTNSSGSTIVAPNSQLFSRSPAVDLPGQFTNVNNLNAVIGGGAHGSQHSIHTNNSHPVQTKSNRSTGWKITWLGVSREGYIITYSAEQQRLATFSLNGDFLCSKKLSEHLYTFLLSEDGLVLLTGGSSCLVAFRWVHNLELANDGPRTGLTVLLDGSTKDINYKMDCFPSPIRSLHLTKSERHLIVGLETGELRVLVPDSDYLRDRLHRKLQELGIL